MNSRLPEGKVPWDRIADRIRGDLPDEVVLGPGRGEDAALVRAGGETWAVASDPVSFASSDAGRLCVWVNANDVAVRGAVPAWFTAVVLVAPGRRSGDEVDRVLEQIAESCLRLGVTLIGGHTEVTPGLPRTLVVGTMIGRVTGRAITTGGLRDGDRIGMTGWAGMEGTSILTAAYGDRLRKAHGDRAVRGFGEVAGEDWLLVVREAAIASRIPGIHALHDVTEGGVGEALHELASASGLELEVDREAIPVLPETALLCRELGIDPMGLIGSGAMLVGCGEDGADLLQAACEEEGVPFAWIGTAARKGPGGAAGVPRFPRDEILKASALDGIEAVVLDMDGTLIDSRYDWKAIREELELTGPSIIDELNSLPVEERERKWETLRAIERRVTAAAGLRPGARELMALLRGAGMPTALVTNNTEENTRLLLDRHGLEFDVVLTRDSGLWKPSGAPVVEAMTRLGVSKDRCLKVGDSRYDLLAAREAECGRVCILHEASGELAGESDLAFPDIGAFLAYLRMVLG